MSSTRKKIPPYLPAAPLIPWLKDKTAQESIEGFASRCGVSDRRIREVLSGRSKNMSFKNIDTMITNEGGRSLIDFYPEYDNDEFFSLSSEDSPVLIAPKRVCSIDGCEGPMHAGGFCNRHYRQHRRGTLAV